MPIYILKPEHQYPKSSNDLKLARCRQVYSSLSIDGYGDAYICCSTWLPDKVGNLVNSTASELLNSEKMKAIIADMQLGNFGYCNDQCPSLSEFLNDRPQNDIFSADQFDTEMSTQTFSLNLNYDQSCNLQCPSCRNELIMLDSETPSSPRELHMVKLHEQVKELINLLLKTNYSVTLGITGSGDPFASPLYWNFLKELASKPVPENLFLNLQTNGILMTKERLEEIRPLWKHIVRVSVSIDAATQETYSIVRKNGNFTKLKRNLESFDTMIINGAFPNMSAWKTNFVVQRDNFRELIEYIKWQLSFKSLPVIWTHLINQWEHIISNEYQRMAVHLPTSQFHAELKNILKDPIFDNPQIKLGNLSSLK